MFKKLLLVGAASVLMIGSAQAADVEAPPAEYDWSGFYAGVIGGYSWSEFDVNADQPDQPPLFDLNQSFDVDGLLVGVEAGWNHQMDSLVFGIAADFAVSGAEDSSDFDVVNGDEVYIGTHDWFATVRGRLGFALDNVLVYATGGLAGTEVEFAFEDQDEVPVERQSTNETLWGWTAGGGIEVAMGEVVSLKAEYLYADFGSIDFDFFAGALTGDADVTTHIVRGGVLFHL